MPCWCQKTTNIIFWNKHLRRYCFHPCSADLTLQMKEMQVYHRSRLTAVWSFGDAASPKTKHLQLLWKICVRLAFVHYVVQMVPNGWHLGIWGSFSVVICWIVGVANQAPLVTQVTNGASAVVSAYAYIVCSYIRRKNLLSTVIGLSTLLDIHFNYWTDFNTI